MDLVRALSCLTSLGLRGTATSLPAKWAPILAGFRAKKKNSTLSQTLEENDSKSIRRTIFGQPQPGPRTLLKTGSKIWLGISHLTCYRKRSVPIKGVRTFAILSEVFSGRWFFRRSSKCATFHAYSEGLTTASRNRNYAATVI